MRILVTGGAGYIGAHTIVELARSGHEIRVVDSYYNSSPEVLNRLEEMIGQSIARHQVDVRDTERLTAVCQIFRPEAVVHFAGLKAVGESEAEPVRYYDVNVGGTISLLKAMEASDCKRVIFSSSATVYGVPEYLPYDEAHPCAPTSAYGRTKHMSEQILTAWQKATPGTAAVLLRYFNPVGAHSSGKIGENPQDIPNNLMPFVAQVAAGEREALAVFGDDYDTSDGTGVRDYIHVMDLARAHVAAVDYAADKATAEMFNIGTGRGYSVLEMIKAFEVASDCEIPYRIAPRRPGDIAEMQANADKARKKMSWQAKYDLADMCETAWRWQMMGKPDE